MFNLKSWRWSRLFELSAWKRVVTHANQIFFVVLAVGFFSVMIVREYHELLSTPYFWGIVAVMSLVAVLTTVCTADKYFKIRKDNKILQRIYLYNHGIYFPSNKIDMVITSKKNGEDYIMREEITDDYHYWDEVSCFLFCMDETYYYLSPSFKDPEPLGKKKTKTIFLPQDPTLVKILDGTDVVTIPAECFIFGKVFIPPVAVDEIKSTGIKVSLPDEYLITKNGKKYSVYGLYEEKPKVFSLQIPIVIFKEMGQDVVLIWDKEKGYREVFRTQASVKRSLSTIFVELTDKPKISGIIRHFNEQTMQVETLYEGRFYAIDFDSGAIVGENGFEYNPK